MKKQVTISTVGGVVAIVAAGVGFWPQIGWQTPAQHDQDYLETVNEMRDFRDEWKCDEYDEELLELKEKQSMGDNSVETEHRIERLKEKMRDIDCSRFDDF